MEVNAANTEIAEASDAEAVFLPANLKTLKSSENDNRIADCGPLSPQDDNLSANEESTVNNEAIIIAVDNVTHDSCEVSNASYGEREITPAFVTVVPENFLQQEAFLSPGFRSAAAMAGWDDESLILATEDSDPCLNLRPHKDLIRETREKKREERTPQLAATPLSAGRRHRRARWQAIHECSPEALPIGDLSLKEEFQEAVSQPPTEEKKEEVPEARGDPRQQEEASSTAGHSAELAEGTNPRPTCFDQLREELSCAICLDICFEPSTTSCGHSFCRGCLESVLQKCGSRCPKCRQQLKGDTWRSCPVNVVLWNTVQLLFPDEVVVRREAAAAAASAAAKPEFVCERRLPSRGLTEPASTRGPTWQHARPPSSGLRRRGSGRRIVATSWNQEEEHFTPAGTVESQPNVASLEAIRQRQVLADAAFARHLQMRLMSRSENANNNRRNGSSPTNLASAAANLRAMANRAVRHRSRHQVNGQQ